LREEKVTGLSVIWNMLLLEFLPEGLTSRGCHQDIVVENGMGSAPILKHELVP
jgi:hypothetical protein